MISPALEYAELRRSYKFREPKAKVGRVCEKNWETFRRHKQQQAPSVGGQPIRLGHFEEGAPSLVRSEGIPVKEKCDISSPRYVRGNSAGFFFFFFFFRCLCDFSVTCLPCKQYIETGQRLQIPLCQYANSSSPI
ncbi:hypothetical protein EJF14_10886 [Clavispora lusitaniae]|uniref:Uncharacterized protein n=1 Tax=Clavispora lusitaniae TaxID=36911 RepID=A0ACD0WDZ4_CLALS|nr:hypothetical protein EJF14_10886 [Clavispora lusitaniae]QFZ36591.1 hypothetical protein EJF15_10886 [Clavispora lusitaniae]QFZ47951.1 hypothetical protein EJF17_10886 [Clavispora lusitaniae]